MNSNTSSCCTFTPTNGSCSLMFTTESNYEQRNPSSSQIYTTADINIFSPSSSTQASAYPSYLRSSVSGGYVSLAHKRASPGLLSNHSYSSTDSQLHQIMSKEKKKKRTLSSNIEDDDSETCSSRRTLTPTEDSSKKQNHSEIEKRRRDKMNTYITELSSMVPVCGVISRKLDKLTVLRMAVEHMKTLRGSQLHSYTSGHYKPTYISEIELKQLILQAAEGFLFVVGCDRGRLLYVSESVKQVLNYGQSELLGTSWFDILHPKDVAKVKEQLNDVAPRERLFIDIRTMLPVKGNVFQHHWGNRLCPGARRSFFCRMKCKPGIQVKEEATSDSSSSKKATSAERKYSIVYCTGYMKPWPKSEREDNESEMDESCSSSCLIAVGRILPRLTKDALHSFSKPVTFTSRHALDGKFIFVDQRATLVLGYLPQELIGTSMYEFYHEEDIGNLGETHKRVLSVSSESITTPVYRFRAWDSAYVSLQSIWRAFRNPWTRDIECLIANNTLVSSDSPEGDGEPPTQNQHFSTSFQFYENEGENYDGQIVPNDGADKKLVGETVEKEVIRNSDLFETNEAVTLTDLTPVITSSNISQGFNSPLINELFSAHAPEPPGGEILYMMNQNETSVAPSTTDEAAMAVIMNLLEADAGLSGLDFSTLPWSLS